MASKIVDYSKWPLVIIVGQAGVPRAEDWGDIIDVCIERAARERTAFYVVFDVRPEEPLTAAQRKIVAEYIKSRRMSLHQWFVCLAIVMSSALQRGTVEAISWLIPLPFEVKPFKDVVSAQVWAEGRHQDQIRRKRASLERLMR